MDSGDFLDLPYYYDDTLGVYQFTEPPPPIATTTSQQPQQQQQQEVTSTIVAAKPTTTTTTLPAQPLSTAVQDLKKNLEHLYVEISENEIQSAANAIGKEILGVDVEWDFLVSQMTNCVKQANHDSTLSLILFQMIKKQNEKMANYRKYLYYLLLDNLENQKKKSSQQQPTATAAANGFVLQPPPEFLTAIKTETEEKEEKERVQDLFTTPVKVTPMDTNQSLATEKAAAASTIANLKAINERMKRKFKEANIEIAPKKKVRDYEKERERKKALKAAKKELLFLQSQQ